MDHAQETANQTTVAQASSAFTFGHPRQVCIGCGIVAGRPGADFRCTDCGGVLEIVYSESSPDTVHSQEAIGSLRNVWMQRKLSLRPVDQSGVWRFRELLPVLRAAESIVTLREGNTPLYKLTRVSNELGLANLFAKHQGMNPTGSFKDTGMTAAISVAKEGGFEWVACASTGNTSASMAAYASRAGLRSFALVPEGQIAWSKLAQAIDYGAYVFQLKSDFDGCVRVLSEVIRSFPVYLVNSVNPFRREGQKSAAFELVEQLSWRVPDHVIVPGGNLANSSAIGKGFCELQSIGMINRLPKISIIQAEGANPLVRSMRESDGEEITPVRAETRATAIRIGNPALWQKAVSILRMTSGRAEDVSESEIGIAKTEIGTEGIGCEPASATTLAGLKKLLGSGFVRPSETVVLILTGHTLKDPEFSLEFHRDMGNSESAAARSTPPLKLIDADARAVIRELEAAKA